MKVTDAKMREASAALNRLVLGKVVETVTLRFTRSQTVIHVTIKAQDELSIARVRRLVRTALEPFWQGAIVIVEPGGGKRDVEDL